MLVNFRQDLLEADEHTNSRGSNLSKQIQFLFYFELQTSENLVIQVYRQIKRNTDLKTKNVSHSCRVEVLSLSCCDLRV